MYLMLIYIFYFPACNISVCGFSLNVHDRDDTTNNGSMLVWNTAYCKSELSLNI